VTEGSEGRRQKAEVRSKAKAGHQGRPSLCYCLYFCLLPSAF
jgi:hypothetical protein